MKITEVLRCIEEEGIIGLIEKHKKTKKEKSNNE